MKRVLIKNQQRQQISVISPWEKAVSLCTCQGITRLRRIGNSSRRNIHTLSTGSVLRCKLTAAWSETTCTRNKTTATRKGISRDLPFAGTVMCSAFLADSSFLAPSVSSVSSDSWLEVLEDMGLLAEPNRLANQPVLFGEVTEAPSVSICMVADCTSVQLAEGRDRKTRVKLIYRARKQNFVD